MEQRERERERKEEEKERNQMKTERIETLTKVAENRK